MSQIKAISSYWIATDKGYKSLCWVWIGGLDKCGYGLCRRNGKTRLAHRYVYELFKGKIPPKLKLDHLCRIRSCVNPEHLEPVTHSENIRRADTSKWSKRY